MNFEMEIVFNAFGVADSFNKGVNNGIETTSECDTCCKYEIYGNC